MKRNIKQRIIRLLGTVIALCVCFLLCRFAFFELHGMKEWPFDLFVFGLAVIIISTFTDSPKVMMSTVIGYMAGFVLGMVFNTDGADGSGVIGTTNNAWVIWTVSFLMFILAGAVWEVVSKRIKSKKPQ